MSKTDGHGWIARARKKSQRCPEWRGAITVEGVEYWLSGWLREDQFRKPYLSLAATVKPQEGEG